MPIFDYRFDVEAPLAAVAAFHRDTSVLRRLMPPLPYVQLHRFEPLKEGAEAAFTLWFGPIPVRWHAVHHDVDPLTGFSDTQMSGPLASWTHTHRFAALAPTRTRVLEHIEYSYKPGWRGWLSRLFFSPPALRLLFLYRRTITRHALRDGRVAAA